MDKFIFSKESGGVESNPPETFIKDTYDNGEDEWYHEMYLEYEKEEELTSSKNSVTSFIIGIISRHIADAVFGINHLSLGQQRISYLNN